MNTKNRHQNAPTRVALLLAIFAMTLSVAAFAHDPLRESREHHQEHGSAHGENAAEKSDLIAVRSLVMSFRETGDDRNLDEAWTLLTPALESSTDDPETLVAAAFVAQSRHEFTYAL